VENISISSSQLDTVYHLHSFPPVSNAEFYRVHPQPILVFIWLTH